MGSRRVGRLPMAVVAVALPLLLAACQLPRVASVPPLRLSEVGESGDPARRASLRLVEAGLRSDAAAQTARALSSFERAIQVDPTNPYAYLALARHHSGGNAPARALSFLDQAHALLEAEGALSPRVAPHLIGLRGEILWKAGRRAEGAAALERAGVLAPKVWDDGHLSAAELL